MFSQGILPFVTILLIVLAAALPNRSGAEWVVHNDTAMTTEIRLAFWNHGVDGDQLIAVAMAELHRINDAYSAYDPESLLSDVNADAHSSPVTISNEFILLLDRSIELSELTGGAFDITFNSVGYHYDYRGRQKPDDREIAAALPSIDYRLLLLDRERSTIQFAQKGVRIGLGGIAKGYAVERVAETFRRAGITSAQISAGGDSRFIGMHGDRPWSVGIQDPRREGELAAVIPVSDEAVSTSGDYQRYFVDGGIRYHHIIDPQTGMSARTVRSATVIGTDGVVTDGLSTGIFVLGVTAGLALINATEGYEAVIIDQHGLLHYSDAFLLQSN